MVADYNRTRRSPVFAPELRQDLCRLGRPPLASRVLLAAQTTEIASRCPIRYLRVVPSRAQAPSRGDGPAIVGILGVGRLVLVFALATSNAVSALAVTGTESASWVSAFPPVLPAAVWPPSRVVTTRDQLVDLVRVFMHRGVNIDEEIIESGWEMPSTLL